MKIEQLYTGCLAQGAYYIESNGEVAIIDPLREVGQYMERAERDGAEIKYIFETHFHADFVSGHLTLAEKTSAPIIFGPNADPSFEAHIAKDGEVFHLGKITITSLHTPGHTMESTTYLLKDENGRDHAVFSGDTLFLGDVGRPDLAQSSGRTQEELAGILYDSLREKIMTLADDVIVFPAHGAGSACGKNLSRETVGTIGEQKAVNYALRADMTKEEFVKEVTEGLLPPPQYFPLNVQLNREGYESIDSIVERGCIGLSPEEFAQAADETGSIILDVRHQSQFVKEHIPGSVFIGLDGGFAPWVGALVADVKQPILLVTPEGREEEAITRLSRVGFDNTLGFLEGGLEAWKAGDRQTDSIESISAEEFRERMSKYALPVFDVRKESEYTDGHVKNAKLTPLDFLNSHIPAFPREQTFFVHCAGGYRSVIAASLLKRRGIHNLIDVAGGFGAIKGTGVELVSP